MPVFHFFGFTCFQQARRKRKKVFGTGRPGRHIRKIAEYQAECANARRISRIDEEFLRLLFHSFLQ